MEEIDLKELFKVFWNKKIQIILIVAIFMVIGVIYTIGFVTPKYSSSAKLLLASVKSSTSQVDTSITATDVTMNSKLVSTYSELVTSEHVLDKVISNLNIDIDEKVLEKNIKVASVKDTEFIQITVTDTNAQNAEKIANEIAKVFIETIKEFYGIENVHVVDEAEIAETPSNINHTKDVVIFAAAGLVVAFMYVLLLNMLDTTIKSSEDIEKVTGLTVIASIPIYDMAEERGKTKRKGGRR